MRKYYMKLSSAVAAVLFGIVTLIISPGEAYNKEITIPVLLYHNLSDEYDPMDAEVNMTPDRFREHMNTLIAHGYKTITFDEYRGYVNGDIEIPDKPIIINFDDGYTSNYTYAYPILEELKLKATILISVGHVGLNKGEGVNYPHFTWQQAIEMEKSGFIEIASHGLTHQNLTELDYNTALREIRRSKFLIEFNMNKICDIYAYAYGGYTDELVNAVRDAGYDLQLLVKNNETGKSAPNVVGSELLSRYIIPGHMRGYEVIKLIEE